MKHKMLLALFLCLVMVFSTRIVSLEEDTVQVKDVSSSIQNYTINNIFEQKEDTKIEIYYPVTKYENVNLKIMQKIEEYIVKIKNSEYISNDKYLRISFENFETQNIISFKFDVKYNEGLTHDVEEVFTIVYNNENIIDIEYLKKLSASNFENMKIEIMELMKDEIDIDSENNKEILQKDEVYSNFIFSDNKIVLFINKNIINGNKSTILEYETINNFI